MDTHVQITAGPDAGPPAEERSPRRRKRVVTVMLAALVLTPGVLLAKPIKQAFSDFMFGYQKPAALMSSEIVDERVFAHRQASARLRRTDQGAGRAAQATASAPADLSERGAGQGLLLKFADVQASVADGASEPALADLDADDAGRAMAQDHAAADLMSGGAFSAARSGPGASAGFSASDGGASAGGSAGAPLANAPGQPGSTTGLDPAGPDPSQLGNTLGSLSAAPEPAAWISMILGFGLTGAVLRRRLGQRQPA